LQANVHELKQENLRLKEEMAPLVKSITKDMTKKLVTLTERLINLEKLVERQPKREILEKQEQVLNVLREELRVGQEQITQLERAGPGGGGSQAGVSQGRLSSDVL
jgi:BMFP domain-containing protein YqiC